MIDAILFDLGDTLIDFGVGRREAEILFRRGARLTYDYLANHRHPHLPPFDRYFKVHYCIMRRAYLWSKIRRRDFSYQDVLAKAAKTLRLHLYPHDLHHLASLWYVPINQASKTDPGIRPMLAQLRHAGTRLGIVSNTLVPPHCLDQHLADEGLLEFFPIRIYSSQVGHRKPHPRIFEIALSEIGVPPHRTLFIGDLLHTDIAGAKRLGMPTIWKPARKSLIQGRPPAHSSTPRRHQPDFILPKVIHLLEALRHFGWHPHSPNPARPPRRHTSSEFTL